MHGILAEILHVSRPQYTADNHASKQLKYRERAHVTTDEDTTDKR